MNLQVPEATPWHRSLWAGRMTSAIVVVAVAADGTIQLFVPAQVAGMLQATGLATGVTRTQVRAYRCAPSVAPFPPPPSPARSW